MSSEKTEEPTDKKLRDARRRGEVPRSRELVAAVGLLAATGALSAFGGRIDEGLRALLRASIDAAARPSPDLPAFFASSMEAGLVMLLPVLLAVMAVGTVVAYVQVGPVFALGRVAPKLERLDPVQSAKRLFGKQSLVELAKALLVLVVVGYVAFRTLVDALPAVAGASAHEPAALLPAAGALLSALGYRVGFALLAIGVADFFYQRYRHRQEQRMTKEEVKREMREAEGDPHAKHARAQVHREIVEHATLEEVRRADVLVVNPTHYAVALSFDRDGDQEAPEVVAKGVDHLARRMIDVAREAGVPIMRDVPLAHALYELEVGEAIPESLYEAVAAVLQAAWAEREEGGSPR